jgi:hypothetical protein
LMVAKYIYLASSLMLACIVWVESKLSVKFSS